MHHTRLVPVLLPRILCLLLALASAQALRAQAVVSWGTPTYITGDSDVATTGTLVLAYNFSYNDSEGPTSFADVTVNGVTFTAVDNSTSALTFTTTAGSYFSTNSSAFASGAAFFTNLSSGYQNLLRSAAYWDIVDAEAFTTPEKITFHNLVSGQTYHVQFWVNDSRGDYFDRVNRISDGLGHEVDQRFDAGTGAQSLGQYVTGSFVADGSTQDFFFSAAAGNAVQLNALTLSTSAVPEPSAYAACAGLAALGLAFLRRRRA